MPREGWKSVVIEEGVYEDLKLVAKALDRSINWTATKMIGHVVAHVIDVEDGETVLVRAWAENFGLR